MVVNMNTQELRRKARQLYNNKLVPTEVNQLNQRKWVRSVLKLGDKWLLAKQVGRIQWLPEKMQSKICLMTITAVIAVSQKVKSGVAVVRTTLSLSSFYTMKTKKQWLKII